MAQLDEELTVVYQVAITGVKRTSDAIARLDKVIRSIRTTQYGSAPVSSSGAAGGADVMLAMVEHIEGSVQEKAIKAMRSSMDFGKDLQAAALQHATTPTGYARKHGNGPGRDDTGAMIEALIANVEIQKYEAVTFITGYHGWAENARGTVIDFQERGTRERGGLGKATSRTVGSIYRKPNVSKNPSRSGIPAANSLGTAIIPVREALKALIARIK